MKRVLIACEEKNKVAWFDLDRAKLLAEIERPSNLGREGIYLTRHENLVYFVTTVVDAETHFAAEIVDPFDAVKWIIEHECSVPTCLAGVVSACEL